jgi:hypothetical protein
MVVVDEWFVSGGVADLSLRPQRRLGSAIQSKNLGSVGMLIGYGSLALSKN